MSDDACLDRDGRPISALRWVDLVADPQYRVVAQTTVKTPQGRQHIIRTLWYGLRSPANKLDIFGTGYGDYDRVKGLAEYPDITTAREGHFRIVQEVVSGTRKL